MADALETLARWRIRWQELEFDVAYLAGVKNQAADALSRLRKGGDYTGELEDDISVLIIGSDAKGDFI